MDNKDMPAMPVSIITKQYEVDGYKYVEAVEHYEGLTKREHFAGLAMQAIIAAGNIGMPSGPLSAMAVKYAESILAELDKAN
jgi:hypothetical protein